METFIQLLDMKMTTPTLYGWFHLLSIFITIASTVILCKVNYFKKDDVIRKTIFIISIITILFEIYKQLNYSFSVENGKIVFDYQWYAFPFQFCSIPMYVGALTGIFKKGRIHNALCSFLATHALFAGLCVMIYPADVFIGTIGINIQTMFNHGSMIVVGIYLLCTGYVKADKETFFDALKVFMMAVIIATIMNEIAYRSGLLKSETFNMFFISPYCEPSLPVYSLVQELLPYPLCLMVYIGVFSFVSALILLVFNWTKKKLQVF